MGLVEAVKLVTSYWVVVGVVALKFNATLLAEEYLMATTIL
jgi:hypothetical protein